MLEGLDGNKAIVIGYAIRQSTRSSKHITNLCALFTRLSLGPTIVGFPIIALIGCNGSLPSILIGLLLIGLLLVANSAIGAKGTGVGFRQP